MKKLLATIMALVMALSLLPTAWATGSSDSEDKTVAKVGSVAYTNLADAVVAVTNGIGKTIELQDNATLKKQLDLSNVTINGHGHTISADTTATTNWDSDNSGKHLINMSSYVVLDDVTLDCSGTSGGVQAYTATNVTLHNVTVKNTTAACALNVNASQVTLTGTFTAKDNKWGDSDSNYINLSWGSDITKSVKCTVDISNATLNGVTKIWTDSSDLTNSGASSAENYGNKFEVIGADAKEWGKNTVTYETSKTGIAYIPLKPATIEISGSTSAKLSEKTATLNYTYDGDATKFEVKSSNTDVATVTDNSRRLTVNLNKAGTTTITVSADKTSVYKAASDTLVLTVLDVGNTETRTEKSETGEVTTTVTDVNLPENDTKVAVTIDASATTTVAINADVAKKLSEAKAEIETVEVKTAVATLTIDKNALKTLTATEGDLVLTVSKSETSTTETKFDLTAKVGDKNAFETSAGKITITVPMDAPGFRQQLVCYYVAEDGARTRMGGTGYKNGSFSWDTNHFSTFVIVTETVSNSRASINISGSSTGTTTTTTTTTGKAASATTFDAGVGIYAATAILSVTGMAWVGKKKH